MGEKKSKDTEEPTIKRDSLRDLQARREEIERINKAEREALKLKEEAQRKRRKHRGRGFVKTFLNPFATTSLKTEIDTQRVLIENIRNARRKRLEAAPKEPIDENDDLWQQLGINDYAHLKQVLFRLYRMRNTSLLVAVICLVLFFVGMLMHFHVLVMLLSFVLALDGVVEFLKAQWHISCLRNDEYVGFFHYLKSQVK